jgi:FkbM family methyltransferase
MRWFHRMIRRMGRELRRVPRPLAYNFRDRLEPSLGPLLAYGKLTRPDFFFVQVGANDGRRADPIHPFVERFGLRGILLEPQPELFQKLRETYAHRPDLVLLEAAVAPHDGTISLHRVRPDPETIRTWVTGIASLDREVFAANAARSGMESHVESISVRSIRPQTLLSQYQVPRISLLQIDTEGYDYEVIKLFDVPTIRPEMIHFEHKHLPRRSWEECLEMLVSQGYQISYTFEDTLACHHSFLAFE